MPALRTWGRRALLAALTLLPLPALSGIAAQVDGSTGHVRVTGLSAAEIAATLAEPERLRLQVAASATRRGMLVTLSQAAGTLVIAPRFALRPAEHRLTLDLPGGRVATAFSLTAPEAPAPSLESFAPSQAVIPANTLRLYLAFSQPMARGQLRRAVTLRRADGTEVPSPFLNLDAELWDPGQTRATLLLDPGRIKQGVGPNAEAGAPLEAGGRYVLTVSGAMESAQGRALGADVRLSFRVGPAERSAIAPGAWQVLAPEAGSRAALTVTFDRIMDSGAVMRLLALRGPDGARVAGRVATDGGGWSLVPEARWQAGRYRLVIDPELEDVSGNTIAAPFDAAPGTIGRQTEAARLDIDIAAATGRGEP